MNQEQLDKGNVLAREIAFFDRNELMLKDEKIIIGVDPNRNYPLREETIELLPEEEEALAAIRKAYVTVLLKANGRKLEQLRKEFEEL